MKYNIQINQLGLSEDKDITIQEASVIDWLFTICATSSKKIDKERKGNWTWVSCQHLITDMPLLRIKSRSGGAKLLSRIEKLGYIEILREPRQLFVKPTAKMTKLYISTVSASSQTGDKDESLVSQETQSCIPQDTYHNTNNIILNTNTSINENTEPLQKEEEIQEEEYDNEKDEIIIPTPKVTLSENKTPVFRIVSVYSSFYRTLYGYNHKHNFAMMLKTFKPLLEMYSEIQIALLLGVMFDWHGLEGNNESESRWLQENCFPPSAFVKQINKYELYIRTKTDYHFEDDNILIGEFRDFVNEYKKIYG